MVSELVAPLDADWEEAEGDCVELHRVLDEAVSLVESCAPEDIVVRLEADV